MKTIVSVKPNQGSSRGLVHYIAHSKTDAARESADGRELFNQNSDCLTVAEANEKLKFVPSPARPKSEELLHLVISVSGDDYARAGNTEQERRENLKNIAKAVMTKLREEIKAKDLQWAGAIHLNTDNPHVHIAVQKQYLDATNKLQTLTKIPPKLLPHYEQNQNEKTLTAGSLIKAADQELERSIAETTQNFVERTFEVTNGSRSHQSGQGRIHAQNLGAKSAEIEREREILARAILAKYRLDKSSENLDSLENHGDKRRFKVFDAVTGKNRKLSLFDLERRAGAAASKQLSKLNITDPIEKDRLKQQLMQQETEKNAEGIQRIKAVLVNLIDKEQRQLDKCQKDYAAVKPEAEQIRRAYRRENKKLPAPALTENELEMLQRRSIEKREIRVTNYFESVRKELARERNQPTRSDEQIRLLKAGLILTDFAVQANERRVKTLSEQKQHFQFRIHGKNWSLAKVDAQIAGETKKTEKFAGRINALAAKLGLKKDSGSKANLERIKEEINGALELKKGELSEEIRQDKLMLGALSKIYANETHPDKEKLQPIFNANKLAEIESLALELNRVEVYKENWLAQKEFVNRAKNSTLNLETNGKAATRAEREKITSDDFVAGRSIAREIISEIKLAEAREILGVFQDKKQFLKFEIVNPKTGEAKQVCARDVAFDARGSLLDQTLEFLTEARDKSETRKIIAKLLAAREAELKIEVKIAQEINRFADSEAADYKQKSFFKAATYNQPPLFTPKELVGIEIRSKRTDDKTEAAKLVKFLDSVEHEQAENLSAMLASFASQNSRQFIDEKEISRESESYKSENIQPEKSNQRNGISNASQISQNTNEKQLRIQIQSDRSDDKQISQNREDKFRDFVR